MCCRARIMWRAAEVASCTRRPDELGRDLGEELVASFPPAILDRDVATVDPAEFAQSLHKRGGPFASGRTRALAQETDGRQLARLLRPRRYRPSGRRAGQRDALAARGHSITSSGKSHSVGAPINL